MLDQIHIPEAMPVKKIDGYKMPEDEGNLLSWDFVAYQMEQARYYWISTVFSGRPPPYRAPLGHLVQKPGSL